MWKHRNSTGIIKGQVVGILQTRIYRANGGISVTIQLSGHQLNGARFFLDILSRGCYTYETNL
jgi:hypothetical protein